MSEHVTDLVVMPSGEVVDLTAPTEDLAAGQHRIGELLSDLVNAKAAVGREITRRADKDNARTLREGIWKITVGAPNQTEWDVPTLKALLESLVAEDVISEEAARRALEPTITLKPRVRELGKLLAHPSLTVEQRAALAACEKPTQRARGVRVEVDHG